MNITPEFIEDLKFRNKIEDVISSYVTLKRAGSNLVGLCPFHSEKTPSFTVFPGTDSFHCFGCGAGGDVITFVMKAENLEYLGAIEYLCNRAGIRMPETEGKSETLERSRFYEMNKAAAKFFHTSLFDESAMDARDYIMVKRGLSKATVTHFGLGYAPDSFDALRKHMHSLGYKDEELEKGFLCGKSKKNGSYYDYFRGRIIFPIIDNFGNVIAFGGRAMGDVKPKYLNSSDTPVFKKSRNLYSLNFARTCCTDGLILCEGYMDVIGISVAGFSNAVATLGTALTQEQARIMAKYTKKVILSYDSDEAGVNATKRAIPILSEAGIEVSVLHMEGAKDPDEYVKKFGKERFASLVKKSSGKLDFLLNSVLSRYNIELPEEKIRAASELCALASEIYSDVERDVYINRIAQSLGIDVSSVKNDTDRLRKKKLKKNGEEEKRKVILASEGIGDRVNTDKAKYTRAARIEENVLGMLLLFPEYTKKVQNGVIQLSETDFITEFNKKVFIAIKDRGTYGGIGLFADIFNTDETSRMSQMSVSRSALSDNSEKVLLELIQVLKETVKSYIDSSGNDIDSLKRIIERKKNKK